jgi:hypothetical protein
MLGMNVGVMGAATKYDIASAVRSLFASSEKGVWYDPSDFSTLYQDSAGTTPVTAVGQPVGLMLDKSQGLVRGVETWSDATATFSGAASRISSDTYRILTSDGTYSAVNAATVTSGKAYEISYTIDSITTLGSGVTVNGTATEPYKTTVGRHTQILQATSSTISIKRASGATDIQISNVSVRELPGYHATQPTAASRPVLQGDPATYGSELASNGDFSQGSTDWTVAGEDATHYVTFADGKARYVSDTTSPILELKKEDIVQIGKPYEVVAVVSSYVSGSLKCDMLGANSIVVGGAGTFTFTGVADRTFFSFYRNSSNVDITIDSVSVREITSYSRYYLSFDGVDDWLQTQSIDFSLSDKMSVGVMVRKNSDAAVGMAVEHGVGGTDASSASLVNAPRTTAGDYGADLRDGVGNTAVKTLGFSAPNTAVFAASLDYAGATATDEIVVRINGNTPEQKVHSAGPVSGTFGNYPLYIGRRGGSSLPFNGRIYSMIVRGALNSTPQTESMERYLASKGGVTL